MGRGRSLFLTVASCAGRWRGQVDLPPRCELEELLAEWCVRFWWAALGVLQFVEGLNRARGKGAGGEGLPCC